MRLAVLRPEPGNAASAARIAAAGAQPLRLPLFALQALAWEPAVAAEHDALFLTSANAVRYAGPALADYRALPVYAVGAATAAAAEAAGLLVVATGTAGAAALDVLAAAAGVRRALYLAGKDRATQAPTTVGRTIEVYESAALPLKPADLLPLAGAVALVHSPRAAAQLALLVRDRAATRVAAISAAALAAAGDGWADKAVAATPDDAALIAAGLALAGSSARSSARPSN